MNRFAGPLAHEKVPDLIRVQAAPWASRILPGRRDSKPAVARLRRTGAIG